MVTEYKILPYLLNDFQSFDNYKQARKFDFNEIRRNIYLNARDYNNKLPDRYYSILLGQEFEDLDSLSLLLSLGIGKMASSYLELSQNKIYIKPEKLNAWQEFIAEIPPLFLTTQFLLLRLPFYQKINEEIKISDFLKNTISINFRYTVLPQARIPQLSEFIRNIGGLSDLHIHINGTIEAQWVWENALASPDLFCNYISNTNVFKELALQSKGITSTIELRDLLIRSRSLRAEMFKHLMQNDLTEDLANEIQGYVNPFSIFLEEFEDDCEFGLEALMYLAVGRRLLEGDEELACLFHEYLLNLNFFISLLVQHSNQFGFEQFQKITSSNLRNYSEESYRRQFLQLIGDIGRETRYIEGRFSPKDSVGGIGILLKKIIDGWNSSRTCVSHECQLALIGHFIKRKDTEAPFFQYRFQSYYSNLEKRVKAFAVFHKESKVSDLFLKNNVSIVGVDAAGSEFDTPPFVFAPFFRELRRQGVSHFTFHAGEDSYSIISGLRAIYEAIEFCELKRGDRIGHASAAGMNPDQYYEKNSPLPIVEYLDDLVFLYAFIVEHKIDALYSQIPQLAEKIHRACFKIYEKDYPIPCLIDAWKLRKYHPLLVFSETQPPEDAFFYNEEEYITCQILCHYTTEEKCHNTVFEIFASYHDMNNRKRLRNIFEYSNNLLTSESIRNIQKAILKVMHSREIVIETLPTSNIMIGPYSSISDYHLWTWLRWEQEGNCIPPIVLGTDDPGIFSTNIQTEYARLYCHMVYEMNYPHKEAISILSRFENNARIYQFAEHS